MLALFERVLSVQLTVAEWVCVALLLDVPYLAMGVLWTGAHTTHLEHLQGFRLVMSVLGSIAFWPVLWSSGVCVG
jgi:hypothetical protein